MDIYTVVSEIEVEPSNTGCLVEFTHPAGALGPRMKIINWSVSTDSILNDQNDCPVGIRRVTGSSPNTYTTLSINPLNKWSPAASLGAVSMSNYNSASVGAFIDETAVASSQLIYQQYEYGKEPISRSTSRLSLVAYNSRPSANIKLMSTVTVAV
jgi:hypothetical protein